MSVREDSDSGDVLSVRSITKYYGENRVLDDVSFSLRRGEIHALLGENGAGKTTLMNILRGLTQPSAGVIEVDGKIAIIKTPTASTHYGIGMVHQHFLLVPAFTVEENLILAGQQSGILLDRSQIVQKASSIAKKLGWFVPFSSRVVDLAVGVQQRVEILKALLGDAKIVLFDEPTAVLTPNEVGDLLDVLRALRDDGRSLIFVSHKLGEVMALCDRVTVLRRGKVVGEVAVSETSETDLAQRMVGEEAVQVLTKVSSRGSVGTAPGLAVVNLSSARVEIDDIALENLDFTVAEGEIFGFAGVDGNGQEELFEVLTGIRAFTAGEIVVGSKSIKDLRPVELSSYGISVIPPDRQRQGLALSLSIRDNLLFNAVRSKENNRFGILLNGRLNRHAELLRDEYDVRTDDLSQPASSLSGGNQQKIVIARALSTKPKIVLAASPTRGLDVAATAYVHEKLRACRDNGASIVLISTELDEVIALSDRIAVLYEGKIASIVPSSTSREQLGLLMGGKVAQLPTNGKAS